MSGVVIGQCMPALPSFHNTGPGFTLTTPFLPHRSHMRTGTQWGCTLAVPYGSEPNEHGTWFYGRNGWCDGQHVSVFGEGCSGSRVCPGQA